MPLGKHVDVSALVSVKRTRRLELAFELAGGHDYRALVCNGFTLWQSPVGTMARKSKRSLEGARQLRESAPPPLTATGVQLRLADRD